MKIKDLVLLILLIVGTLNLYSQDTIPPNNYKWCIEWLDDVRPAILADTLGRYGAKWSGTERIMKENCDFVGELFPIVEYYFGCPDMKIDNLDNEYITDKTYSMIYIV